jgi:hypothetical protein
MAEHLFTPKSREAYLPHKNQIIVIMKDNKYFCYTIDNSGERGFQRIDKEYAIQLNNMGRWFYKLPFKVVNSLTKALRWKYHLRD